MRLVVLLASTSLLAACGGGGAQTLSSTPPPVTGGGLEGPTNTEHTFADPKEAKTYVGIGANHVNEYLTDERECCDQQGKTYAGNTTTIRDSSISISYDPADAIYTLVVEDGLTGADTNTRFQDPGSRTDFGGEVEPQWGTPRLSNPNINYLQAGDGNPLAPYDRTGAGFVDSGDNETPASGSVGSSFSSTSLFILRPGSETQYVTYAGYVRNALSFQELADPETFEVFDATRWHLERGAFVFGEVTANDDVPDLGTGSFEGSMLASMIYNPTLDGQDVSGLTDLPDYFQWIEGTANLAVNFAEGTFTIALDGSVLAPHFDRYTNPQTSVIEEGATFSADGKGDINLVAFGGFKGFFENAGFVNPGGDSHQVAIEGSTVDGAFYGPNAEEAGGGFRIVGGNPDERVDILGTFIGK